MTARWPKDARAPRAVGLQADALFRDGRFDAAEVAYESTFVAARRAGLDSLARRAAAAVPVCALRHAEASVAADSSAHQRHAEAFARVARRWPAFEHAHVARYRAGLSHLAAGDRADAVREFEGVIRDFPKSPYVRDAHLQIANAWKAAGKREKSAEAWLAFAARYPRDSTADDAWLEAADLLASAGEGARAETLRLEYIRKWPDDHESAMEILEPLARRDLASVTAERPISTWLPPPAPKATKTSKSGKPGKTGKATPPPSAPASPTPNHLAEYLRRAEARPDLASKSILAQRRFLEGEEAFAKYSAIRLTQPLEKSIALRKARLDALLAAYGRTVDLQVPEWSHAATYRIGEALVGFGEALEKSERPADLKGDDLLAYEDVVLRQSNGFHDRGEAVWIELLKATKDAPDDPWLEKTKSTLWGRLANRFYFRPEPEYPVVSARPPDRKRTERLDAKANPARASADAGARAPREGTPR